MLLPNIHILFIFAVSVALSADGQTCAVMDSSQLDDYLQGFGAWNLPCDVSTISPIDNLAALPSASELRSQIFEKGNDYANSATLDGLSKNEPESYLLGLIVE